MIQFIATVGNGVRGDIAIDNVLVESHPCDTAITNYCDFDYCDIPIIQPSSLRICAGKNNSKTTDVGSNKFLEWDSKRCGSKYTSVEMDLEVAPRGSCLSFDYLIKDSRYCLIYVNKVYKRRSRTYESRLGHYRDGSENTWVNFKLSLVPGEVKMKIRIKSRMDRNCKYFAIDEIQVKDDFCG